MRGARDAECSVGAMPLLVRLVSFAAWPGEPLVEPARVGRAIGDFSLRVGEQGLSLWEATSPYEKCLFVVARACTKQRVEKIDFLEIDDTNILSIGSITPTPGDSPVPKANRLHRELRWDAARLRRLAERLIENRAQAQRVKRAVVSQILRCIDLREVNGQAQAWLREQRGEPRHS